MQSRRNIEPEQRVCWIIDCCTVGAASRRPAAGIRSLFHSPSSSKDDRHHNGLEAPDDMAAFLRELDPSGQMDSCPSVKW